MGLIAAVFPVVASSTYGTEWAANGAAILLVTYFFLLYSKKIRPTSLGRAAVGLYCTAVLLTSWWFVPIWLGIPLPRSQWDALMSLKDLEIFKWI